LANDGLKKETASDFIWSIDPLDSTTNIVHHATICCVYLNLYHDKRQYTGFCYNPMSKELFYAQEGKGACRNGQ